MKAEARALCTLAADTFGKRFGSEDTIFTLHFDIDLNQAALHIRAVRNEIELISTKFRCEVSTPNLTRNLVGGVRGFANTGKTLSNAYIAQKTCNNKFYS